MAGGGGENEEPPQKQDDLQPHPVKDQLYGITYYCLTSPPWPGTILLGFQHYLVMLGTTVLIPSMLVSKIDGRNKDKVKLIQSLLFVSGLNTLSQSFSGTRLPAVIGASYSYVLTTTSIILAARNSTRSCVESKVHLFLPHYFSESDEGDPRCVIVTEAKKKGGHTATPHAAKKGGKSPVNANQSPKSGGQSSGAGSNKKPFNSGKQFGGSNNKGSNKGKGKGRA